MKLKPVLQILGLLAVFLTLLPFVAMDYWWIRMLDFPHTQLTILTFVAFMVYFIRFDIKSWRDYTFVLVLGACFLFQLGKIYPYTPFAEYQVENSKKVNSERSIGVFAANVLQKNTKTELLIAEILRRKPNLIILTETNERWRREISPAVEILYPYKVEVPLDNTYGMLLYSNYELENPEVRYLVDDSIPSIHSLLILPSGEKIQLHAIHPTPPMPQHNPSSTDRDAEMMMVAKMARESDLPVIVTGDFNDVAWSRTTSLFLRVGGLLDPRVGRGFYNTYNANSWFMRWPLDHLFVSKDFKVLEILKGNPIESDHFPFYALLSLEAENASDQKPDPATEEELEEAQREIKKEAEENGGS